MKLTGKVQILHWLRLLPPPVIGSSVLRAHSQKEKRKRKVSRSQHEKSPFDILPVAHSQKQWEKFFIADKFQIMLVGFVDRKSDSRAIVAVSSILISRGGV